MSADDRRTDRQLGRSYLPREQRVTKLAQAQGRVSVQADCTSDEALALMMERAVYARLTLDEIADGVGKHRIWFN